MCAETATDFKGCIIVRKGLEGRWSRRLQDTPISCIGFLKDFMSRALLQTLCIFPRPTIRLIILEPRQ